MQPVRRRWVGLGVLGAVALAAHLLAFSGLDWAWPRQQAAAAPAAAVQVRLIDAAPETPPPTTSVAAEPELVPAPVVVPPTKVVAMRPRAAARMPMPAPQPAPPPPPPPAPMLIPAVAEVPVIAVPVAMLAVAAPVTEAAAGLDTIPHYRTQMPPALTMRYVMQRGALSGRGELSWRPESERYELKLVGSVAGLTVLTQISAGGFDAAGVAPLRFTDQRWRRGTKAANFQREAGKITFSGPSTEFPLRAGAQDRLSWMVQLGAIVAAEPELRGVGAKVVMYVVGANGEAGVWAFDCTLLESVTTGAGPVSALKFVREPREPYDTQVQVWIDPAQHYLPVRATQKSGANDEGFELRLQSVELNP
jgi:Protein of unknown function (DUF3108)